jgi:uncharacterized protein YjiS (DUF1127 family)
MRDTSRTTYRDDVQTEGAASSLLAATRKVLAGTVETLLRWQELSMQRRRLLELDAHMLKDIGLSRADAVREAKRPFWDQRAHRAGDREPGSYAGRAGATPLACCQR